MASWPRDCWNHLSDSISASSSSSFSSSLSQTSSSIEHVWSDIKFPPLSNSPVDLELNNHSSSQYSSSSSSFLNQSPSTFLTLTSSSTSLFHKHSLLSVSNTSLDASLSNTNKTPQHQDQRHLRIIRNRESAVRSRARKQAYRKGLEVEIARLTEENSRLRRQLKQLQCCLSFSDNAPTMAAPCKTSSSPF